MAERRTVARDLRRVPRSAGAAADAVVDDGVEQQPAARAARIDGGEPEEDARCGLVSMSYFDALGVPAGIGRVFDGAPEPAEGGVPQAVISHDFWQRRFGGRADVIGAPSRCATASFQVIGVAPRVVLRRDGRRAARRVDAAGDAGHRPAGTRLAARRAGHRREGDVAARVRPAARRRDGGRGTGRSQRHLPAGAGRATTATIADEPSAGRGSSISAWWLKPAATGASSLQRLRRSAVRAARRRRRWSC